MSDEGEEGSLPDKGERDVLAEERTVLAKSRTMHAFIRTGLAFIGVGFAVVKFLYVRYWSVGVGGALIAVGAFMAGYYTWKSWHYSRMTEEVEEEVREVAENESVTDENGEVPFLREKVPGVEGD
ncbi:hypothetical protein AKJ41_06425 [candidate division MSBL1 archaeon SCGC-AAA259O05]|uniref:DUF202 domain-containing protein n=1 Tax=candidate division MSBL1 archaeon SCGC-AAA259O05 TaxID=1698271 RepID=A0A133UWS5_9EURY|nr:hypothetical protein AKJ41_06425 [candidate division MSBL1 archaeon SCGC-AAA259O05]